MEQSRASLSTHAQQLNAAALAGYEEASRHKARKRDGDDDHSVSSFDVNSLKSRSVLTVGTVDSE
jgi:meiosis induction protein kinase IME2/SME1